MKNHPSKAGFTLIELLVVISIIGLLATVVLAGLNSAQKKGRDTRRKEDLHQLAVSLEQYHNQHGAYPVTGLDGAGSVLFTGARTGSNSCFSNHDRTGSNGWIPDLAPEYIPVLPLDPQSIGPDTCYLYGSDGSAYKIMAYLTAENECPVAASSAFHDPKPVRDGQCTFSVWSNGAENF